MGKWLCGLDYSIEGLENIPDTPSVIMIKHTTVFETYAQLAIFPPQVRRDALQSADRDRLVFDAAAAACGFAGAVADAAEDAREYVRLPILHIGIGESALSDEADI